ncbi:MAG: hypothetical protein C0408_10645, partial [Odoribacter sp.]|nr:hypothetical protein [Odoribacter sp.]
KQVENQITLLSITYYKTPQMITSLNKEAGSIKSQVLFNAASKKYTVIGTLYYDKYMKILGETSLPGFVSGSENFSVPLEGNANMTILFNKAVEYLNTGVPAMEVKETAQADNKKNGVSISGQKKNPSSESAKPVLSDTSKALDRVSRFLSKRDSVQKVSSRSTTPKTKTPYIAPPETKIPKEVKQAPVTEPKQTAADSKESAREPGTESNPKSTIFKEGSKYSFQVSSWRNESKAQSEVLKLTKEGHTAFIAEGIVNGQTWYRVRVGYFNSLDEAEQYMKKVK